MTYMEAWHLVAPTIANTMLETKEGTEAYVMMFRAIKKAEEQSKKMSDNLET